MLSPRAHDAQDGGVSEDSADSGGDRLLPFFSAVEEPAGSQFLAPDSYIRGVVRHGPSVAHGSGAGSLRFADLREGGRAAFRELGEDAGYRQVLGRRRGFEAAAGLKPPLPPRLPARGRRAIRALSRWPPAPARCARDSPRGASEASHFWRRILTSDGWFAM